MTTTKHAPTPYKLDGSDFSGIRDIQNRRVATVLAGPETRDFLILAANPHDEAREALSGVVALALDMGRVIRSNDEAGEHSEFWANDGDYVPDGRFEIAADLLARLVGTAGADTGEPPTVGEGCDFPTQADADTWRAAKLAMPGKCCHPLFSAGNLVALCMEAHGTEHAHGHYDPPAPAPGIMDEVREAASFAASVCEADNWASDADKAEGLRLAASGLRAFLAKIGGES